MENHKGVGLYTPLQEVQVGADQTITFSNSDPANTQVTNTITKPDNPVDEYELVVYNPSTVTDLTVKVFSVQASLGGGSRDALITTLSIPKSQTITGTSINTYSHYLHGIFNGTNCKLVFSNDTVLGGSDGFSAYFRLQEVK